MEKQDYSLNLPEFGLDLRDPALIGAGGHRALNVIKSGGALRTVPGFRPRMGNSVYVGGTSGKAAVWCQREDTRFGDRTCLIHITAQSSITGADQKITPSDTPSLLDGANSHFTPAHVGCVVKNTTTGEFTVVIGFEQVAQIWLADEIFPVGDGDGYELYIGRTPRMVAAYTPDHIAIPDDLAVLGELTDDTRFCAFQVHGRLLIVSGRNAPVVVEGDTLRQFGMRECRDNNDLVVDFGQAGNHDGQYKFALTFYDEQSLRYSPPLYIENEEDNDGFFELDGKKLVFDTATMPTNVVDVWTHYQVWVKRPEWYAFHLGAEFAKDAGTMEEDKTDDLLRSAEGLVENRIVPKGWTDCLFWKDRMVFWRHYAATLSGTVSIANGSKNMTIGGADSAEEWMEGAKVYIGPSGSVGLIAYDIRRRVDATTLELWSEWTGATITNGDARICGYSNRLILGLTGITQFEYSSPWHYVDINPDDGDYLVACIEVGGHVYALKRESAWRVIRETIVDQLSGEVPTIFVHQARIEAPGCCGPEAATTDDAGRAYWVVGPEGMIVWDGVRARNVSEDVAPYFRWQDVDTLHAVSLVHNAAWKCIEVYGLKREDGTEGSLRYQYIKRKWYEGEGGLKPVSRDVGVMVGRPTIVEGAPPEPPPTVLESDVFLIPMWYYNESAVQGRIGVLAYDLNGAYQWHFDHGPPDPFFENEPWCPHTGTDSCGMGRTGKRYAGQKLGLGLERVWVCDGAYLSKYPMDPVTESWREVSVGEYDCHALTRMSDAGIVYFNADLTGGAGACLKTYVTVADEEDGSTDFQIATDFATLGPRGEPLEYASLPYLVDIPKFSAMDTEPWTEHPEFFWAPFLVAEDDYAYFTAVYTPVKPNGKYSGNNQKVYHEVWRTSLTEGATAEQFLTGEESKRGDEGNWAVVRDVTSDPDGNPIVAWMEGDSGFPPGEETPPTLTLWQNAYAAGSWQAPRLWIKKYDKTTKAEIWESGDIGAYVQQSEIDLGYAEALVALSPHACCEVSNNGQIMVAIAGVVFRYQNEEGLPVDWAIQRILWVVKVEPTMGTIQGHARFQLAYCGLFDETPGYGNPYFEYGRRTPTTLPYGIAWVEDGASGNFYVLASYLRRFPTLFSPPTPWDPDGHYHADWPEDFCTRLFRVNEDDLNDTSEHEMRVGKDEQVFGLGISYHG